MISNFQEPFMNMSKGHGGSISNTTANQQNRAVINAFFDYERFVSLKKNLDNIADIDYETYYNVPMHTDDITILQGDMVFKQKIPVYTSVNRKNRPRFEGGIGDNGAPKIFSTLNGAGTAKGLLKLDEFSQDVYLRNIMSNFEFVGLAQGGFNMSSNGLQASNQRTDLAVQIGGIETIFNTGSQSIRAGNYVVWGVPNPMQLKLHPPRVNDIMRGRTKTTVFFTTEPYDFNKEFNMENLYEKHKKIFNTCSGFNFGEENNFETYLPTSFANYENDFSLEGYHKCLFGHIFAFMCMHDVATTVYKDDNVNEWDGPIKDEDIQKIIKEAQNLLLQGMNNLPGENKDRLKLKRILNSTLIAIEASYFANYTDIYRTNGLRGPPSFDIKGFLSSAVENMLNINSNLNHDYQKRIIGKALTSGAPGHAFDIVLGMSRSV